MDKNWYYSDGGRVVGPFDWESLELLLEAGKINTSTLIASEGDDSWRSIGSISTTRLPEANGESERRNFAAKFASKVSQASGLERPEGFSFGILFSQVLKKRDPDEIEERFDAGTVKTTPFLEDVAAEWPTPWVFFRLLGLTVLLSLGFFFALVRFMNPVLIPGFIFVGCFGIPFATLVFFMESNILRNISFYRIMTLMLTGGLVSMIFSLFLFEISRLDHLMGAMAAGLVEESGKLLAVIFFTRKWSRNHSWILNGLLCGAAVGTGFSAFESAGYVFVSLAPGSELIPEEIMILRAVLSPFTHTIWTAAIAAALWRVKGQDKFRWAMVADMRFLRVFGIIASLHLLWNSPLALPLIGGALGKFGFYLILGTVGWMIILSFIHLGVKEVREAQAAAGAESLSTGPL